MFQGYSIKDFLEELHKMLLSTLIGNTTENVDVVCIRFYTVNLVKEWGLRENHANTSKTYETCGNKTNDQMIKGHGNTILRHFNILHNAENKCLPIYWLRKRHKNPSKIKFIIPAPKWSLRLISKSTTSIFKFTVEI